MKDMMGQQAQTASQSLQSSPLHLLLGHVDSCAMALLVEAMDPICAGILEFLNGWALVLFLATCKAARGCAEPLRIVQDVKNEMELANAFLSQAVLDAGFRFPGFQAGEVASAQLIPVDPLPDRPGKNMRKLGSTYELNPAVGSEACFHEWVDEQWPEGFTPTSPVGHVLLAMNTERTTLSESPALKSLAEMLHPPPCYVPSWTCVHECLEAASGLAAQHYPPLLFLQADCKGFPAVLYIQGKIPAMWPCKIVFL